MRPKSFEPQLRWRSRPRYGFVLVLLIVAPALSAPYLLIRLLPVLPSPVIITAAGVGVGAAVTSASIALLTLMFTQVREIRKSHVEGRAGRTTRRHLILDNVLLSNEKGGCPLVREIRDLESIGVSRAMLIDGRRADSKYIPREIDVDLLNALKASGLVLVLGESKAGKSRTTIECIKQVFPERVFVSPAKPESLRLMLAGGTNFANTVIWMENLDRYLGPDGINRALINRVTSFRDCCLVATMRSLAHAQFAPNGDSESPEWAILQSARAVRLPRLLTIAEREAAEVRTLPFKDKLDRVGLAEYISGAPDLLDRYRDAEESDVCRWAVVRAIIDLARCGFRDPPFEVVVTVVPDYCLRRGLNVDVADIERALNWALQPIYGASSLVVRVADGFRPFDYLLDHCREAIFGDTWAHAYKLASPDRVLSVGIGALLSGEQGTARKCFVRASQSQNAEQSANGLYYLALLEELDGNRHKCIEFLRKGDQLGLDLASFQLGQILNRRKRRREAEVYYRRALDRGCTPAAHAIAHLAARDGRHDDARKYFQIGADGGDLTCRAHLAEYDYKDGNTQEGERNMTHAANRGNVNAVIFLAKLRASEGKYDDARRWYEIAAAEKLEGATLNVGFMYELLGDKGAAERWYRTAQEEKDSRATAYLGRLLALSGRLEEAEPLLVGSAKKFSFAAIELSRLYIRKGNFEKAREILETAANAGHKGVGYHLGRLLLASDLADAEMWFRREADAGNACCMAHVAILRLIEGDLDNARRWAGRAAAKKDFLGRVALVLAKGSRVVKRVPAIMKFVLQCKLSISMQRFSLRYSRFNFVPGRLTLWLLDAVDEFLSEEISLPKQKGVPRRVRRRVL